MAMEELFIMGLGLLALSTPKAEETDGWTQITTPTTVTPIEEPLYNTIEEIPLPQGVKMEDIIAATTYNYETGFYTMPTVEQVLTYLANLNQPIVEQPIVEPTPIITSFIETPQEATITTTEGGSVWEQPRDVISVVSWDITGVTTLLNGILTKISYEDARERNLLTPMMNGILRQLSLPTV